MATNFIQLSGIARLASEGVTLEQKRRVEYRTLPTRKWLNRCQSARVPFTWSINPYRGCEYGCKYCYARYTHEFMELRDLSSFETEIFAKEWNAKSFAQELRAVKPKHVIGIGTATDPYQPAERRFSQTRNVLEALSELRETSIFITSKSDIISRDTDILLHLAKQNSVRVTVTITTMDVSLARLTEPFAPRPDLRMAGVSQLAKAGVPVGVIASPVLPLITDSAENLEAVAKSAKDAGASYFGANVLFLKSSAQQVYFPFLADRFPQHLGRYRRSYGDGAFLKGSYPERIQRLVASIRTQVGIVARDLDPVEIPGPPAAQMQLF